MCLSYRVCVNQRNANNPPGSPCDDSSDLIESVIKPLQHCHAAVLLPELMTNTVDELRNGRLRNVRELEVMLTSCHEVCMLSEVGLRTY